MENNPESMSFYPHTLVQHTNDVMNGEPDQDARMVLLSSLDAGLRAGQNAANTLITRKQTKLSLPRSQSSFLKISFRNAKATFWNICYTEQSSLKIL